MPIELYIHILERPECLSHSKFRQVYGFTEHDCDKSIKSFTDHNFKIIYEKKVVARDGNHINELAKEVNDILNVANNNNSLDFKQLDNLLNFL